MKSIRILFIFLFLTSIIPVFSQVQSASRLYSPSAPVTRAISSFYGIEEVQVVTVGQNCADPDDVLVTLFMAKTSEKDAIKINNMRKQSMTWPVIMEKLGVHPSKLFVQTIPKNIIDPYTRPYSEYMKWKKNPLHKMTLYDKEIRNLVGMKLLVERFHFSVPEVMKKRNRGVTFSKMIQDNLQLQ